MDKKVREKRIANARAVAGELINAKAEVAKLQTQVKMQEIQIEIFMLKERALRSALQVAYEKINVPKIDMAKMPGDLSISDLADLCPGMDLHLESVEGIKAKFTRFTVGDGK
jgi:hypothetical protein